MGVNQDLGNLVLILAHARAAIRHQKVKIRIGPRATENLHWDQVESLEPALVYFSMMTQHQRYDGAGVRVIGLNSLPASHEQYQANSMLPLPTEVNPCPEMGCYGVRGSSEASPSVEEERKYNMGVFSLRPDSTMVRSDFDFGSRESSLWHGQPLSRNEFVNAQKLSAKADKEEKLRLAKSVPRYGRFDPSIPDGDPEYTKKRKESRPSASTAPMVDEFDREGRDSFMASHPLGDSARGWYPVTIVHPKANSRLKTIARTKWIIICWVQQGDAKGGFIEAWTIDQTVTIAGQGLDANNAAGWEYLLRHATRE